MVKWLIILAISHLSYKWPMGVVILKNVTWVQPFFQLPIFGLWEKLVNFFSIMWLPWLFGPSMIEEHSKYTVKPPYRDILYKGQTIIRKLPGFPAGVENKGGGSSKFDGGAWVSTWGEHGRGLKTLLKNAYEGVKAVGCNLASLQIY